MSLFLEGTRIILASASPRRRALLRYLFPAFEVIPSGAAEIVSAKTPLPDRPALLAGIKAEPVAAAHPDALVIGSDTAVLCGGEMLGKPASPAEARRMLRLLSGKTHRVVTGCCLMFRGARRSFSEETEVTFYPLRDDEIDAYLETGEPFDKAGSYGLQGPAACFVQGICGDPFNVIGLPVARLKREIEALADALGRALHR